MIPNEALEAFEAQMKKSKSKNVALTILEITDQNKPKQVLKVIPFNKVNEFVQSLDYVHISTVGNPVFSDRNTLVKLLYRN